MAKEPIHRGKDKSGKNIWLIQVSTGVKVGGKYQRVSETFHGTKADAKRRQREIENQLDQGINIKGGKILFSDYANQWLDEKKDSVTPRTMYGYEKEVKKLSGSIGHLEIGDIKAPTIRNILRQQKEKIIEKKGSASNVTIRATYTVLNMILSQAVKDDLIPSNPCFKVDRPRGKAKVRRSLTFEQYIDFLKLLDNETERYYKAFSDKEQHLKDTGHHNKERHALQGIKQLANITAVRIAHATGMRPSEILALQWKHVDFTKCCICIVQATSSESGGIKETKTESGRRNVFVDEHTMNELKEWRMFQFSSANKIGIELDNNSFVICSNVFTQVNYHNVVRWFREWIDKTEFAGWEMYELRHTQATLLLNQGAPIASVKERMGHSSINTTMIYTHTNEETQKKLATIIPTK